MSSVRLLLILTENNTMRPPPDVGDLVRLAVTAEQAGIDGVMVSDPVWLEPQPHRPGGPTYGSAARRSTPA